MIITRTPFRVSFFGGGTDYPAWYREHGGTVLATTIDKYCYITCRYLPQFFEHKHRIVYSRIENVREIGEIEHPAVRAVLGWKGAARGLEIHHDGDLPARAGLGSSSSFTVGLLHALSALEGRHVTKQELAAQAIHVEQDLIREAVGSQDQVSAAYGGFNRIEFRTDDTFGVEPVVLPKGRVEELQERMMLCFTGLSRNAPEIARGQIANFAARAAELTAMRAMVGEAMALLRDASKPLARFGRMLDESWQQKRRLSDKVSTPEVDAIYERAKKRGALGGKLLGAGGGGFMLLFAEPDAHAGIREALPGLVHVPMRFEGEGSKVVLYQPSGL
ncbi:MAG: kinase [Betaproteobacteria bacterium]|nr:kinase [Betaproteobacteria bacterium]